MTRTLPLLLLLAACGEPEPKDDTSPPEGDTDTDTDADSDADSDSDSDADTDVQGFPRYSLKVLSEREGRAAAVTDAGYAVGYTVDDQVLLWTLGDEGWTESEVQPGVAAVAFAVNSQGHVLGQYTEQRRGFFWTPADGHIDLSGTVRAMNDADQVVGFDPDSFQPWIWEPDGERTLVEIDAGAYGVTSFVAISDAGLVGASVDRGVYGKNAARWDSADGLVELDNVGTNSFCTANAMNQAGSLVGWCMENSETDEMIAVTWPADGVAQQLTEWASSCYANAMDISDDGLMLGTDSCGPSPWLRLGGDTVPMLELVDDMQGWEIFTPMTMSAGGTIAGRVEAQDTTRPALLIPVE